MKSINYVIVLLSVLFLIACSSPTPVTPDGYPLDTKTGIQDIDNILSAVASGKPRDLQALIQYTEAPCTWKEGLGGPPKCREGEVEGTMLEVLPFLGSEGSFIRKNEIGQWTGINAVVLYAVFGVAEGAVREQYYLPGEYIALFLKKDSQDGVALHITDGRIVRVDTLFSGSSDSLDGFLEQEPLDPAKVILAPLPR